MFILLNGNIYPALYKYKLHYSFDNVLAASYFTSLSLSSLRALRHFLIESFSFGKTGYSIPRAIQTLSLTFSTGSWTSCVTFGYICLIIVSKDNLGTSSSKERTIAYRWRNVVDLNIGIIFGRIFLSVQGCPCCYIIRTTSFTPYLRTEFARSFQ